MSLAHAIKEQRPNLADSSVKTYNSILTNLHKKVFGNKEIEVKDFGNTKEILACRQKLDLIDFIKRIYSLLKKC